MTEDILKVGSQHVEDVQTINRDMVEKTLRMRCLAYLSQVQSKLLVETIHDMNESRKVLANLSQNLEQRNRETVEQKNIIEQQKETLSEQNKILEIEKELLALKVGRRSEVQKQAQEILERSQKMESLGKLSSGISHDYNNMLGVITGYAELLEKALDDQPKLSKFASHIRHAGERGCKLTKKLLNFSKKNSTEETLTDINDILIEEAQIIEKSITSRICLKYELADNLWPIWIDQGDLEDAIINMSINAMQAIEDSGNLTIKTCNESLNTLEAHVLQLEKGEYVLLSITDTGKGMKRAVKDKIFEPFYSTKGEKGTGLGLSQVYGFVTRSGGAIKVYSEQGEGTCLSLFFPRSTKNIQLESHAIDIDEEGLLGNETILIVDDDSSILSLSCEILKQNGYQVIPANNAEQALEILNNKSIDLLLTDVIMPTMSGYELSEFVLQKYPRIQIQLASGFADIRHNAKTDERLFKNMLHKPYSSLVLLKSIRSLLDNNDY